VGSSAAKRRCEHVTRRLAPGGVEPREAMKCRDAAQAARKRLGK
jgi:hypothetical protein